MQKHVIKDLESSCRRIGVRLLCVAFPVALECVCGIGCKDESKQPNAKAEVVRTPPPPSVAPKVQKVRLDAGQAAESHLWEGAVKTKLERTTGKCEKLCDISKPLGCKNAHECMHHCKSMAAAQICVTEMDGLFDCLTTQPAKNWECDEDGIGAIRDPFCGKEQAKLASCLEAAFGQ